MRPAPPPPLAAGRAAAASHDAATLAAARRRARSTLGELRPDQTIVVAGRDVHAELVGRAGLGELLHLFVRRELPPPPVARLLEAMVACANYPDIRIWPIGSVAMAASAGATPASTAAIGHLALEAEVFGIRSTAYAYEFLIAARERLRAGATAESIVAERLAAGDTIAGFGRPVYKVDERVPSILAVAASHGLDGGPALAFAREVEAELDRRKGIRMNYAGAMAALFLDLGYDRDETVVAATFLCHVNFLGVHHEHARSGAPVFPIACDDVEYLGPAPGHPYPAEVDRS